MKRSIATLFLLAAVPLVALAANPAPLSSASSSTQAAPAAQSEPSSMFKELDVNHDGYITKAEAERSAEVKARFATLDVNHDGKISWQEYEQGMKGQS